MKGEELEKQLEYAKQREAAIEQEFRDTLSSVGSDKSLKEASHGKLTERQIAGVHIKKEQLQAKLRRITEAFKYVQATGTKISDETLQRYEQIRKKIARELRLCLRFLEAEQEEVLEEKPSSPTKPEGDQQVPSHSPIPRETVSPIGKDTIPPRYKVTTPPLNGKSMGPTLSESLRERADALYKTHTIINGYGLQSTPLSLEILSKQFIAKSDKKSLKVPLKTTPQLNEFLLHNPGIIEPDKLDWDYEDDQQSHGGSYSPTDNKRTMTTPPQTSPLDLSTSPKRSDITVPGAPMSTPRRGTVNIREANWRQGRSNIQSASDILKRVVIDCRRVNLPPGTKLPIQVYGEVFPYPCKYCNIKYIGRICPCKSGWIHLMEECPNIPHQPPKEEKPEYPVSPCWSCGQQGHFARTCSNVETSTKKLLNSLLIMKKFKGHMKKKPYLIM